KAPLRRFASPSLFACPTPFGMGTARVDIPQTSFHPPKRKLREYQGTPPEREPAYPCPPKPAPFSIISNLRIGAIGFHALLHALQEAPRHQSIENPMIQRKAEMNHIPDGDHRILDHR